MLISVCRENLFINDISRSHIAGFRVKAMRILSLIFGSLIGVFVLLGPAFSQVAGVVVEAAQPAELQRGSGRVAISERMQLQLGDIITTGQNGRVQIIFSDETRIAVSANSRLVIDEVLFDNTNRASRFAVSAVAGAFRFISGNSAPDAYSINTPLATLGIRGTIFDFAVTAGRGVDLATFDGQVRLCFLNGGCTQVAGRCTIITAPTHAERFEQPETLEDKRRLLEGQFPFVVRQDVLRRDFRAPVRSCGYRRLMDRTEGQSAPEPQRQRASSSPAPESSETASSTPGGASATQSGATASATQSGASATQSGAVSATATGAGAGAAAVWD